MPYIARSAWGAWVAEISQGPSEPSLISALSKWGPTNSDQGLKHPWAYHWAVLEGNITGSWAQLNWRGDSFRTQTGRALFCAAQLWGSRCTHRWVPCNDFHGKRWAFGGNVPDGDFYIALWPDQRGLVFCGQGAGLASWDCPESLRWEFTGSGPREDPLASDEEVSRWCGTSWEHSIHSDHRWRTSELSAHMSGSLSLNQVSIPSCLGCFWEG